MAPTLKFDDNWPVPNAYLTELGRMTCLWASLEAALNVAISKFAGYESDLDPRALVMVAHSNFQQRVDIVGALCEQLLPEFPKLNGYKSVVAKIQTAQRTRNRFAHNGVTLNPDTGEVYTSYATARGSLKTATEVVPLSAIIEASAKIHEAICALMGLVTGKEYKPVWERSP